MSEPIYKIWLVKAKAPFFELTPEEQQKLGGKVGEALAKVGGETVIQCNSWWCSENWQMWGVEKFPNIEAVQKHADLLVELNWFHYVESNSYLGTKPPES